MYQPPIKGKFIKRQIIKPKNPLTEVNVLKQTITKTDNDLKAKVSNLEAKIEDIEQKTIETSTSLTERTEQAINSVETLKNEVLDVVSNIKDGENGKDGISPEIDYQSIIKEVLSKIPEPEKLNIEDLIKKVIDKIPKPKEVDVKKIKSDVIKSLPQVKSDLKIIREKVEIDPMAIVEEIMKLPADKFKLKLDQIDGLDQTISAFRSQLARGYLGGGGQSFPPTDNISMGGFKITNLGTPTDDTDGATKGYVDAAVAVENLWDRSGTTLSPHNANDNVDLGSGTFKTTNTITGGNFIDFSDTGGHIPYTDTLVEGKFLYSNDLGFDGTYFSATYAKIATIYDATPIQSIKPALRKLYSSSGQEALDWENRYLVATDGLKRIDWQNSQLYSQTTTLMLDWGTAGTLNAQTNDFLTTGNIYVRSDANKSYFGAGNDMTIWYDGTYGQIKTSDVAASDLRITTGANKTLELQNNVYEDIQFPISSGKVPAVNFPTWETFTTNTSAYAFSVNDLIDLQADELIHKWAEGTQGDLHLHFAIKTAQSTGANRYAKFTIWLAISDATVGSGREVWTELSPFTAEYTIPTGSSALQGFYLDMGDATLTNYKIGSQIKARIKRIAATGGTEYADDVYITQVGLHIQLNTIGSRQETIK